MSFQPFAVQCLTCGSRLRVTDPAIVGTIAACPKCSSMVQIERPAPDQGDAPEPSSQADPTERLDEQAPTAVESAAQPQPAAGERLRGGIVAVGSSGVDSQAITEEAISGAEPVEMTDARGFAGGDQDASVSSASASETSIVPPDWQSERTRRSRQIALVALVSVTGLITAIAMFSWFVHNWRRDRAQAEVTSTDTGTASTTDVTQPAAGDALSNADQTVDESSTTGEESPPIQQDLQDADAVDADPGAEQADQVGAADQVETADQVAAADQAETGPTADSGDPVSSLPMDLIPQSPIADPIAQDDSSASKDDGGGGMQQLPPELAKYTKFLLDDSVAEKPTLAPPPTMEEIEIDAAAEASDDPLMPAKAKPLNLKADLGIRLAVASDGYPLTDFVLLISQVTGVPIQIDWVSFDLAGVDINDPVPTAQGWLTAQGLLDKTAKSLGAELRPQDSVLILTLSDAVFQQRLSEIADLSDFGDGQSSAQSMLNEFLGGKADADELVLGESREQQQLAGLAIEALRRMRGLAPKVDEGPFRHWATSTQSDAVQWPLVAGGDPGNQRDMPITLAGFLRRTARTNQVACVVNWFDATRRGATPEHLFLPHVEADAAATLERELSRFKLQVRQVDAGHWWIGSEATYDRLTAVVWTPPLGEAREEFTRRIGSIMGGASSDVFRISFDQESDRALLLLPRYIGRQLPKIAPAIAANRR